ncbi:MAG: hypothetical protein C0501_24325 [Isosphaera sp.]|nr:hypothetical protein [Isosphaera sp.]
MRRSAKYRCIEASVCELGVIQPLVMFPDPPGRLWAVERETGKVTELKPGGRDRLDTPRFAREGYLPKADLVMFGVLVKSGEKLLVPFYDPKRNEWVLADVPGSELFNAGRREAGASVDLGLVYDPKRELVFAVLCHLEPGAVRVLRLDGTTLKRIGP